MNFLRNHPKVRFTYLKLAGYFLTKIFHPNVAVPSGEICVSTLKKDWDPANWSLKNIFQVIKCLLIVPFPESSLNEDAGKLFMEDYDNFVKQAKIYTSVHARPKKGITIPASATRQTHEESKETCYENGQNSNIQSNQSPSRKAGEVLS